MTDFPAGGKAAGGEAAAGSRPFRSGAARFLSNTLLLTGIHLRMVRWAGPFTLLISFALPAGMMVLLRFMNPGATPDVVALYVAGNMVNAVIQTTLTVMAQTVANQREQRTFAYYMSLPVHKISLVVSLLLSFLLQGLPGFVGMFLLGGLVFHVNLVPHWTLIPLVFFLGSSLAAIGAFIGVKAKNGMAANTYGLSLAFVSMFLLPVYYPVAALPPYLRPLVYLFPVTYGADGIRRAVMGTVEPAVWVDLAALVGFAIVAFAAVTLSLKWQDE